MASTPSSVVDRRFGANKEVSHAFVVIVTGRTGPRQLHTFAAAFSPLAEHVARNEEGCLAYEFSVKSDDPDSVLIYERYVSKEYCEAVHWASEPFKEFQKTLRDLPIQWVEPLTIKTFVEKDIGFA